MYISPHDNTETAADNKHGAVPLPFPQSILNYTSLIRRQYHPSFPIGMAHPDVFGQTFTLSARLTVPLFLCIWEIIFIQLGKMALYCRLKLQARQGLFWSSRKVRDGKEQALKLKVMTSHLPPAEKPFW